MGKLARHAIEHLKEIFWAVFLLYLFLAGLALLFGRHVGYAAAAWICLGFAILMTVIFGSIFAINLLVVLIVRAIDHFRHSKTLL